MVDLVPFTTTSLGAIQADSGGGWYEADPVKLAYFGGEMVPVELFDVGPEHAAAIDAAAANVLALGQADLDAASPRVLANCHAFLDLVEIYDEDEAMLAITNPADIWAYVQPRSIQISRDDEDGDPAIYVALICRCDWESEHGLQIVYRGGVELTRVSAADGRVIGPSD
jgi:hypothetical protein